MRKNIGLYAAMAAILSAGTTELAPPHPEMGGIRYAGGSGKVRRNVRRDSLLEAKQIKQRKALRRISNKNRKINQAKVR